MLLVDGTTLTDTMCSAQYSPHLFNQTTTYPRFGYWDIWYYCSNLPLCWTSSALPYLRVDPI